MDDTYKTVERQSEGTYKDKASKFTAYCYPVDSEEGVKEAVEALKREFYDARHHCYAYRLGPQGERFRVNDDGEPSGTAGKPILGQMLSCGVTNVLIVVVRYFGGTKLGVPGLITAYREAAADALANNVIITGTVNATYTLRFPYIVMNEVMKIIKEMQPEIVSQTFDNVCQMELSVRMSEKGRLEERMAKVEGLEF